MAGSNNFTIHNPANANQEPDSTFATDALTTGGIPTDAIMPSPWMNARWYEDSVGFWAFAQSLANKGYVVNKDNPTTLSSVMANVVTFADLKTPLLSLVFSPTPTFDASVANGWQLTLGGPVTSSTLSNLSIGQVLTFMIVQGIVPYSFTPPAGINGWRPVPVIANTVFTQQFIVRADLTVWPFYAGVTTGQVTVPGAFVGAYGGALYDTGIPCAATDVLSFSFQDQSTIIATFTYFITRNAASGNIAFHMGNNTGGVGTSFLTFVANYKVN